MLWGVPLSYPPSPLSGPERGNRIDVEREATIVVRNPLAN
jgi:hypothetical protein